MTEQAPLIRLAATAVLLRNSDQGLETLLLRRNAKLAFAGGAWVFPGGAIDEPEMEAADSEEKAARLATVREVEEECNVKAILGDKICTTYHTYTHKNKLVLKKTRWYAMNTNFTGKLIPQTEEGIEKVEWLNEKKQIQALTNTYSSIRYVIEKFKKLV